MSAIEQALDPIRLAINLFLAWADTPGDLVVAALPPLIVLGLVGLILTRRSGYWRRT